MITDAELTFVLTAGGRNAGIVSEPGHPHRSYQVATQKKGDRYVDPDRWQATTALWQGSWWCAWLAWLERHSSRRTSPPPLGAPQRGYPQLADAPGTYVLER